MASPFRTRLVNPPQRKTSPKSKLEPIRLKAFSRPFCGVVITKVVKLERGIGGKGVGKAGFQDLDAQCFECMDLNSLLAES